jgi:hypothetical protein
VSDGCVAFQVGLSLLNVARNGVTGIPICNICTLENDNSLIKFGGSHEVSSSRVIATTPWASKIRTYISLVPVMKWYDF